MDFFTLPFALTPAYRALQAAWQCEEGPQVMRLLATASQTPEAMARIKTLRMHWSATCAASGATAMA